MTAEVDPPAGSGGAGARLAAWGEALWEGWLRRRDRLLASPRFHRFAAGSLVFRPFARARARALFDLCAGFTYSQTLLAAVRLDLFEILADGPQRVEQIAARAGLSTDAAERLLTAAAALRLAAKRRDGRYRLGDLGAALRGAPGLTEMVEHHALLYRDLADPVALLKGERRATELGAFWPYTAEGAEAAPGAAAPAAASTYSALMSATQPLVAEEVLAAYDIRRHRRLLDIGGGEGAFLIQAAARAPALSLSLIDLPPVAAAAREKLAAAGLGDRATAIGGDFLRDAPAGAADLVTLIRVLFDHDDDRAVAILSAARRALTPDGALLLAEPMAETPGAEPIGGAYYGFYLLAMGGGRPRTAAELSALARRAGFSRIRAARTRRPILARALIARP